MEGPSNMDQAQNGEKEKAVYLEYEIQGLQSFGGTQDSPPFSAEKVTETPVLESNTSFHSGRIEIVLPFEEDLVEVQNMWNIGKTLGLKVNNERAMIEPYQRLESAKTSLFQGKEVDQRIAKDSPKAGLLLIWLVWSTCCGCAQFAGFVVCCSFPFPGFCSTVWPFVGVAWWLFFGVLVWLLLVLWRGSFCSYSGATGGGFPFLCSSLVVLWFFFCLAPLAGFSCLASLECFL